jgi:uncharacterized alpha-E superfamily protein
MLSRTADNLYWLARYVERAEYLARILETTYRMTALPLAYVGTSNEWESAVATAGCGAAFFATYSEANEETVTEFLAFSPDNPSSIRNCIETARVNARAVRTALTSEMWDTINSAWLELKKWGNGPRSREEFARFLRWVQEASLRFDGSAYRTMLRNDAYWFSRLGLFIERADNTARILDVKYHLLLPAIEQVGGPLDYFQWTSILRSVSALTAYHWVYRENVKPWPTCLCSRTKCHGRWRAATKISYRILTASRMPMGARAARSGRPAPCAPACKTAASRRYSRPACTNSSTPSSRTTTSSAPRSRSNI